MNIRKARHEDIYGIVDMACEFESYLICIDDSLIDESPSEATFRSVLEDGFDFKHHHVYVIEDEHGDLVGYGDYWTLPEFLHGGVAA